MAKEAERLLSGSNWLPEPLRTPDEAEVADGDASSEPEALPAFLTDDGEDEAATADPEPKEYGPHAVAAE